MNPAWLFYHIIDALRSEFSRPPVRDVYCPLWLAVFLGAGGMGVLASLLVGALVR